MQEATGRLSEVIIKAVENGCKFDGWGEHFKFDVWMQTFDELGIDPNFYTARERSYEEVLPWDHIDIGVTKNFLMRENEKAKQSVTTPNCRQKCAGCGVKSFGRGSVMSNYILKYSRDERVKYISHLDFVRLFHRTVRRTGMNFMFSNGFNPSPDYDGCTAVVGRRDF